MGYFIFKSGLSFSIILLILTIKLLLSSGFVYWTKLNINNLEINHRYSIILLLGSILLGLTLFIFTDFDGISIQVFSIIVSWLATIGIIGGMMFFELFALRIENLSTNEIPRYRIQKFSLFNRTEILLQNINSTSLNLQFEIFKSESSMFGYKAFITFLEKELQIDRIVLENVKLNRSLIDLQVDLSRFYQNSNFLCDIYFLIYQDNQNFPKPINHTINLNKMSEMQRFSSFISG